MLGTVARFPRIACTTRRPPQRMQRLEKELKTFTSPIWMLLRFVVQSREAGGDGRIEPVREQEAQR